MDERMNDDEEAKTPETPAESQPSRQGNDDFVSDIRQDLSADEERAAKTGNSGLLRRITGILHRPKTGTLPPVEQAQPEPNTPQPEEPTLPTPTPVFVDDQPPQTEQAAAEETGAEPVEAANLADVFETAPTLIEDEETGPFFLEAASEPPALFDDEILPPDEPPARQNEPPALIDETRALLGQPQFDDSDSNSAPDQQAARPDQGDDEASQSAPPQTPDTTQRPRGLRGLITGVLRLPETRNQPSTADEMDDRIVTARLQRSLGQPLDESDGKAGPPRLESGHEPLAFTTKSLEDDDTPDWNRLSMGAGSPPQTRPLSLDDLEPPPVETADGAAPEAQPFIEEEDFLIEEEQTPIADLSDGSETIDGRLSSIDTEEEEYLRHYWGGPHAPRRDPIPTEEGAPTGQAFPANPNDPLSSLNEVRSELLQSYGDLTGAHPAEETSADSQKKSTSRLLRGVLVALLVSAIALAGIVGLYLARSGAQQVVEEILVRPTGAPLSGAVLPTGLELPGGWYFALERNTLVDGQWKPQAAEWLEDSELPRVVAIPWNRQTEAVIQTFEPGDPLIMSFTNRSVTYKVREVKRVPLDDTSIFQDRRPALVVVLYQENADERWVVICQ